MPKATQPTTTPTSARRRAQPPAPPRLALVRQPEAISPTDKLPDSAGTGIFREVAYLYGVGEEWDRRVRAGEPCLTPSLFDAQRDRPVLRVIEGGVA
jgi:hypothetical protein